jgi:hypothetical protein
MDLFIESINKNNFKDKIKYLKMKLSWDHSILQENKLDLNKSNILNNNILFLEEKEKYGNLIIENSQKEKIKILLNSINELKILQIFKEYIFDFFIDEIWFNIFIKDNIDKIIEEKIGK